MSHCNNKQHNWLTISHKVLILSMPGVTVPGEGDL